MLSNPDRGICKQIFPLAESVLRYFKTAEAFKAVEKSAHQYALHPVGLEKSAEVRAVCNGCVFMRPGLKYDDPNRAFPSIPAVQVHTESNVLSTHMSCTHMMSPSCLQKGEKIADPPLLDIE